MEWSDDVIARLRVLWIEGLSTAEIGRRRRAGRRDPRCHPWRPRSVARRRLCGQSCRRLNRRFGQRRAAGRSASRASQASIFATPARCQASHIAMTMRRSLMCACATGARTQPEPGSDTKQRRPELIVYPRPHMRTSSGCVHAHGAARLAIVGSVKAHRLLSQKPSSGLQQSENWCSAANRLSNPFRVEADRCAMRYLVRMPDHHFFIAVA